MKQSQLLRRMLSVAGVGTAAVTLLGVTGGEALAGISATKHNLSVSGGLGGGNGNKSSGTEICVFCHTPHAADTSAPAPLWNKQLGSAGSYTTYASMGSSTLDAVTTTTGSVSLACLSCHDGTQAMDNIINAPGAGGYDSTGGGSAGLGYTWSGSAVDSNGKMTNMSTTLAMLGTDLRNDHPIGISYCAAAAGAPGTCIDTDFVTPTQIGTTGNWYVEASGNTSKDKSDMILYTRGTIASVECASCHDPHVETKTATEVAFLRKSQAGSGVCLACHTK